jgi:hypothetical protein
MKEDDVTGGEVRGGDGANEKFMHTAGSSTHGKRITCLMQG